MYRWPVELSTLVADWLSQFAIPGQAACNLRFVPVTRAEPGRWEGHEIEGEDSEVKHGSKAACADG